MKPDTSTVPALLELHDNADPSFYRRMLRDAHRSHRCPVLISDTTLGRLGELHLADPDPIGVDAADPYEVLSSWWPGPCPDGCRCLEPHTGELPPLIRNGDRDLSRDRATIGAATEFVRDAGGLASMAVVEAARPADVARALLWSGMCNYHSRDLNRTAAVLRSWEERFGALVVHVGPATLVLTVARPPRTTSESELVATEHFAFCPDQHDPQNGDDPFTPRTYGATIREQSYWRFWWD